VAGLELLALTPDWLRLLVVGAVGGVALGLLLIAVEKAVSKCKHKQNYEQANLKGKNMSSSVAAGMSKPVVVDLENCYISDSSELEEHDFKAELAASKSISIVEVENNLQVTDNKLKEAALLFAQAKKEIQSRAKSLDLLEVNDDSFIYFIIEFCNAYGLTVDGYSVLLEIVESFWDYCPINIREYFRAKAQEILDIGYEKTPLEPEDRQALLDGQVDKLNVVIVSDEGEEELSSLTLNFSLHNGIQSSILKSLDSYNRYVDIALRFAYSVFGAAARNKNREEIGSVDEIDYYLSLPEEKILQRVNDLKVSNAEDWIVSVEPGEIDMKKIEEINEVLGRYGQRIELPKISDCDSPES
jgi:hypothetical protein